MKATAQGRSTVGPRPIALGEAACQRIVLLQFGKLEDGVEVDVAFGQGQITFLSGKI
ncbi:MAG: hypothetical protein MUC83_07990 [Pirellula sp.]|nr:hypothetical protein [Pirellula sp.]